MDLFSLAIVGAVVSAVVGYIKNTFGTSGWKSVGVLVVISLIGGFAYWYFKDTPFIDSAVSVLISANVIYTILFKQLAGK